MLLFCDLPNIGLNRSSQVEIRNFHPSAALFVHGCHSDLSHFIHPLPLQVPQELGASDHLFPECCRLSKLMMDTQ